MSFRSDLSSFKKSIRAVAGVKGIKGDGADIINRALKDVAFRAMQFTTFATPTDVAADLYRNDIGVKIVAKALAKKRGKARLSKQFSRGFKKGKTKTLKKGSWQKMVSRELKAKIKRRSGPGRAKFRRAGWIPAVLAMGGAIRGGQDSTVGGGGRAAADLKAGGAASRGYADAATPQKLRGTIANVAYDSMKGKNGARSRKDMDEALSKAVRFVARDREQYAQRKIEQTLRKNSDR